jgi:hypothetical protein
MNMQQILQDLNNDFFLDNDSSEIETMIKNGLIEKEAITDKWLGYSPTNEQAIALKEKQFGVTLPPSYKSFLLTSNGFRYISFFLDNLLPLEKIDWAVKTESNAWLEYNFDRNVTDEEYLHYDNNQAPTLYRHQYLKDSLKISNWSDGMCVFLNPIIKHDEEWEVLAYATWYPGTRRYRSFEEFLIRTHEKNLELINDEQRS